MTSPVDRRGRPARHVLALAALLLPLLPLLAQADPVPEGGALAHGRSRTLSQ